MSDFEVGVDNSTSAIQKLEQLRQRVIDLEGSRARSVNLREQLAVCQQRVAELEELSVTRILVDVVAGDGSGHEVYAKSVEDVKRLLSELSEKAEDFDLETVPLRKQLAASQLENKRLRSALESAESALDECRDYPITYQEVCEALHEPTDTEALEKYVADRLGDPVAWREFDGEGNWDYCSYEDNETYRDDWIKRNPKPIYKDWVQPLYSLKEPK